MKLNVALLQMDLVWENPKANLEKIEWHVKSLPSNADLVALPEMFTTGFTMTPHHISNDDLELGKNWMMDISTRLGIPFCGSLAFPISEKKYTNRFFWIHHNLELFYDKRHLFTMAGEKNHYKPGHDSLIIDYKGWKIKPFICYDLRFPVWLRNNNQKPYDLLLGVANWPAARIHAWETLLLARSIENQCYSVGVNRIGTDGTGTTYSGRSFASDFFGQKIADITDQTEGWVMATLDKEPLMEFRHRFPVLNDMDNFTLLVD